jgi:hypothetical protein
LDQKILAGSPTAEISKAAVADQNNRKDMRKPSRIPPSAARCRQDKPARIAVMMTPPMVIERQLFDRK